MPGFIDKALLDCPYDCTAGIFISFEGKLVPLFFEGP